MSTRIVDRHGEPFPTEDVRRRIGFIGERTHPVDLGGEVIVNEPRAEMQPILYETRDGEWTPPHARQRPR